jgi:hypothetical protein
VQPRALWVVAHHLEVGGGMSGAWMSLFRALAAALAGNEELVNARRSVGLACRTYCCL